MVYYIRIQFSSCSLSMQSCRPCSAVLPLGALIPENAHSISSPEIMTFGRDHPFDDGSKLQNFARGVSDHPFMALNDF